MYAQTRPKRAAILVIILALFMPASQGISAENEPAFKSNNQELLGIAWSEDDKYLASVGSSGYLEIWDTIALDKTAEYQHESPLRSVEWSPNGAWIAIGSNTVDIFNPMTLEIITTLPHEERGIVQGLGWSPTSETLATGEIFGEIKLWNTDSWEVEFSLFFDYSEGIGSAREIKWSPDSNFLAASYGVQGNAAVMIWDTQNWHLETPLYTHWGIAWSPDSEELAIGGDGLVITVVDTWQPSHQLSGMSDIRDIDWAASTSFIATTSVFDNAVFIFDKEYALINRLNFENKIKLIRWSSKGDRLAVATEGGEIYIIASDE